MTGWNSLTTVDQDVQSANSPEVVTLRTSGDTVPTEFSAYEIQKAVIAEVAAASGEVGIQDYDDDNSTVEEEVSFTVAADETIIPGEDDERHQLMRIDRGNQIRIRATTDVDVTLYIEPLD